MEDSFGARMRQHREGHGISLTVVAHQTKIKESLLEGLERDDISRWPAGIFRRAYVRAYAAAIGQDPDTIAREFLAAYPEPVEAIEATSTPAPQTRLRSLVDSAFGSLSRRRTLTSITSSKDSEPQAGPPALSGRPAAFQAQAAAREASSPTSDMTDPTVSFESPAVATSGSTAPEEVASSSSRPVLSTMSAQAQPERPDLMAAARLCTELGRVETAQQVGPLLGEAARILDAQGIIVWGWDPIADELRPALVHGYSDKVRAQLPGVRADADNATAAAFRSSEICAVRADDTGSAALAVPLLAPGGCAGVLAIELVRGSEHIDAVRAIAVFIAAMLAQLFAGVAEATASTPAIAPPNPIEARHRA